MLFAEMTDHAERLYIQISIKLSLIIESVCVHLVHDACLRDRKKERL